MKKWFHRHVQMPATAREGEDDVEGVMFYFTFTTSLSFMQL